MSVVHTTVRATVISGEIGVPAFPADNTSLMSVETPSVSDTAGERHNIKKNGMSAIRLIVRARQIISTPVVLERKRARKKGVGRWCQSLLSASANICSAPIPNEGSSVVRNCTQIICVSVNGIGIL